MIGGDKKGEREEACMQIGQEEKRKYRKEIRKKTHAGMVKGRKLHAETDGEHGEGGVMGRWSRCTWRGAGFRQLRAGSSS